MTGLCSIRKGGKKAMTTQHLDQKQELAGYSEQTKNVNGSLVSVVVPVGGNRVKSIDELKTCVNSILLQSYRNIEVILVIDPDNHEVRDLRFFRPIRLVEYIRLPHINGRDASERRQLGCDNAFGKVIVLTNVGIV